jgi:hypothetical protein
VVAVGCAAGAIALVACGPAEPAREATGSAPASATAPPVTAGTPSTAAARAQAAAPPMATHIKHYTPQRVTLEEPKIDLPHEESFRLLEPGSGDKAALRYALAAGTVEFTARAHLSSRHLDRGAFTAKIALPAIRDGFAVTVSERPGAIVLRALPGEAEAASDDAAAYLAPWKTLLQDRRVTLAFAPRGQLSAITFNDDPGNARGEQARDELAQRLLSLVVPLPAEPVGTGARWRVVTILRQGPAYAKQTAVYTLVERGAARWKIHVELRRVAEEQRIADPALPRGVTADLQAMFRAIDGDVEVDPRLPLIAQGSLTVESRLHVKLTKPDQTQNQTFEQVFEDTGRVELAHTP